MPTLAVLLHVFRSAKTRKRKILNTEIKDGTYNILVQGMTKLNEKDKVKAKCVETDSFDFHPDIF